MVDARQLTLDFTASPKPVPIVPPGFVRGSIPGTIAPTWGRHKGVPMFRDSAVARCLMSIPEADRRDFDRAL